jgi:hypothetical protein
MGLSRPGLPVGRGAACSTPLAVTAWLACGSMDAVRRGAASRPQNGQGHLRTTVGCAARQGHGDSVHASPAEIAIVDNVANTDDRQCQFSGIHL